MADKLTLDEMLEDIKTEKNKRPTKSWSLDEIDSLLGLNEDTDVSAPETTSKYEVDIEDEEEEVLDEELEAESSDETEDLAEDEETADAEDTEVADESEDLIADIDEKVSKKAAKKAAKESAKGGLFARFKAIINDEEEDEEEEDAFEAEDSDESEEIATDTEEEVVEEEAEAEETEEEPKEDLSRTAKLLNEVSEDAHNTAKELLNIEEDEDIEEVEVPNKEEELQPETEEQIRERRALAQKTIGIYPIRNEKINHQIVTDSEKIERTGEIIESNKYRERFLNVPKQHLERTADYEALHLGEDQGPIERDGLIIKKSNFKNTQDLEAVPMIVSADAELSNVDKTIVAATGAAVMEHEEDEVLGQIKLLGFGEEEEIEQIDEWNAEETLKEKRADKVNKFKLDTQFEDDEETEGEEEANDEKKFIVAPAQAIMSDLVDDEYVDFKDERRIKNELSAKVKSSLIRGGVQLLLTIISIVITTIISKQGGSLEAVGGGAVGCAFVNIIILVIASVCSLNALIRGFKGILKKKLNASSGIFVVVAACLLEDLAIMLFARDGYTTVAIYTAAACFALFLSTLGRLITLVRTKNNFDFITGGTQLYSTEKIYGEDDAFEIGRGLLIGDPEIYYNARMERPSYFIENSFEDDPADEYAEIPVFASLAAGLLFAIIFGIVHHSLVFAFGVIAASCCIIIPGFLVIASNIALFTANREFNKNGGAIVGHRAVEDSTDANAYVFDSTDIFKKGSCSIIGIKTFHGMRIDDAILYAAALVIESDGPLADIFDGVILGKKDLLPPVESLAYEERLGLSSWIHGRRVLIGTRDLLVNHNVDAPEKSFEDQYTHDGRKVIYLAIAGKIAAMFVVKYQPDKQIGQYLRKLDKAGVAILVRSCDCNITEEMICEYFGLPLSAVKILSPVSGDIFERYREEEIETAPAGLIHNGTLEASINSFYEARELQSDIYVNKLISYVYSGFAFLLCLILTIVTGKEGLGISGLQIVLFQFFWTIVAAGIPALKRKFLGNK